MYQVHQVRIREVTQGKAARGGAPPWLLTTSEGDTYEVAPNAALAAYNLDVLRDRVMTLDVGENGKIIRVVTEDPISCWQRR